MDPFEDKLRARLDTLESAAPVSRGVRAAETRMRRRPSLRWGMLAGVAAAAVIVIAVARPAVTEASTRTYSLDQNITVTAKTHATWAGTVDQATAEAAIRKTILVKLGPDARLHVTSAWQIAGTLDVKGTDWSMAWSGPEAKPLDVWVVEFAGTSSDGWPVTASGVVDAQSGSVVGGGLSEQIPVSSLNNDPNKPPLDAEPPSAGPASGVTK